MKRFPRNNVPLFEKSQRLQGTGQRNEATIYMLDRQMRPLANSITDIPQWMNVASTISFCLDFVRGGIVRENLIIDSISVLCLQMTRAAGSAPPQTDETSEPWPC